MTRSFVLAALLAGGCGIALAAEAGSPADIPRAQPGKPPLEARIGDFRGHRVIFVNGEPMAPQMYSGTEHSRQTWTGLPRKSLEEFSSLGYDLIQTDLWFKYSLRPDGTFDLDGVRRQLAGILEVNPNAKIVIRVNVSAPKWWLQANPGEICQSTNPDAAHVTFGGNSAESLASEKYQAFAAHHLKEFLHELARTPEGDRVIGVHLGGGVYGEWHYYGIYHEPDASAPMRRAFAAFALARYGTLSATNVAWHTSFAAPGEITVPSFARRHELADGDFRDPQADRYVIDYYECQQSVVATLVNRLAQITKETWPRPLLVGLFYGYFYGGFTVGAQASQLDIKTLFRSPYVDLFSGPYASRDMRGSGVARTLVKSVVLNGKLWMTEHDGGSHLGNISGATFPNIPENEAQSIARMRRNFMHALTENGGQWWYDFGPRQTSGGWSTPALQAEAKALLQRARTSLQTPYAKPADVLVVYDMEAFYLMRPARTDRLTSKITEAMTDSLLGTGAAIDRVFLMDLEQLDLSPYKLVIFGNTFVLNASQRAYINERVKIPGRTVVFMSGAGYSDGQVNRTSLISDLAGMTVEKAAATDFEPKVSLGGQAFAMDGRNLQSRFKVVDREAEVIGTYSSGTPAAARRNINNCHVYYFGVPVKGSLDGFKALLAGAGVRSYVENTVEKDYVSIGRGLIAIYSVSGGEKVIRPLNGQSVRVSLEPFSARYFDLVDGHPLD